MSSLAARYLPHYTAADYQHWQGDWELWDGVPVAMSPSLTPRHQLVAANLVREIGNQLRAVEDCECLVVHETDWHVRRDMVVRPDVAVLCQGLPGAYIDYPPTVVVEVVSPSTADKNRRAKAR